MCVPEHTNRVQTLGQMLWVLANNALRWIGVQYDDDETAFIIFCAKEKKTHVDQRFIIIFSIEFTLHFSQSMNAASDLRLIVLFTVLYLWWLSTKIQK